MDGMKRFVETIRGIGWGLSRDENIAKARKIVSELNRFLYARNDGLGTLHVLGQEVSYFSEFHKFWEAHHEEILDISIDDVACAKVAEVLHGIYEQTEGKAFREIYDTCGLDDAAVCRVRLLTANQDFRGSRKFANFARLYDSDPTIFDIDKIIDAPDRFLADIGVTGLSQNDKRRRFAKQFALFVKERGGTPVGLAAWFENDLTQLREAMISCEGAGYGNKKTDMVIRDMVVHGIWQDVSGFENIDVASDINTIGVALRTGILKTAIPLLSSFLDEFCCQYSFVDRMNAAAWRRVWEIWRGRYPSDDVASPCLLDYFIYEVVGRQFCRKALAIFQCEHGHVFRWHSGQNKTCQVCFAQGHKHEKAALVDKVLPCEDAEGYRAIEKTDYVKSGQAPAGMRQCPFKDICDAYGKKGLQPPKSISIFGLTGWTSAYANDQEGGGGLMA